jgi:hypothetical protein
VIFCKTGWPGAALYAEIPSTIALWVRRGRGLTLAHMFTDYELPFNGWWDGRCSRKRLGNHLGWCLARQSRSSRTRSMSGYCNGVMWADDGFGARWSRSYAANK